MGFGDLKTEAGLKSLNEYLASRSYIEGYQPSQADTSLFTSLSSAPASTYAHALRWYNHIKSFGNEKSSFAAAATTASPAAAKSNDDDDVDLFGSDEEEDAEAEKLKEERVKAYAEKKSKKPALIAKSSVILDVKPWDDETDMKVMEQKVRSIVCDGLVWGAAKLVPVGYGIHKLQIMCVVEDEKVAEICDLGVNYSMDFGSQPSFFGVVGSVSCICSFVLCKTVHNSFYSFVIAHFVGYSQVSIDWLQEEIQNFEDVVQSVDIAAFNKI